MTGSIRINVFCDACYLGIKTYSREHGRHGRFLLKRELVEKLLSDSNAEEVIDTDCGSFVVIRPNGDSLIFQFDWLYEQANQIHKGLRQTFTLPRSAIKDLLSGGIVTKSFLYQPPARSANVDHRRAGRTIRRILSDKHTKRAFSKAMRDAFQWPGEQVVLHNDGGCNFFFTTERTFAICGGLILHEGAKNGYPAVYYSVHT